MRKILDNASIQSNFTAGINCAQIILSAWADEFGLEPEDLLQISSPFGCGMFRGETCGAVTGALMAIGLRFGNCEPSDFTQIEQLRKKTIQFQEAFIAATGSTLCSVLLDSKVSNNATTIPTNSTICPQLVSTALTILSEVMSSEN